MANEAPRKTRPLLGVVVLAVVSVPSAIILMGSNESILRYLGFGLLGLSLVLIAALLRYGLRP